MNTRIKICGITSVNDALVACDAGVSAIGLVFYEKSPRYVSIQQASDICDVLPPFVVTVGLFLDANKEFVESVLARVPLDLLQFHGSETGEFCDSFLRPYIKAVGMKNIMSDTEFTNVSNKYTNARGFLVDSHADGKAGGTGFTFDWKKIPQNTDKPIILAGGLGPENIATAMQSTNVYGYDLSSGVESEPGIKDKAKITQLMQEVKRVQCKK